MRGGAPGSAGRRCRPAVLLIGMTLVVDQISKYWVLNVTNLPFGERISLLPVLDLVLTWNRGVSYGLFRQEGELGRWLLVAATAAVIVFLAIWLWKTDRLPTRLGLALTVGGAVGNLIDRVSYGAVVDFVYFHFLGFSWYVFNLADCAIVAGVGALLYDSFRSGHSDAAKPR